VKAQPAILEPRATATLDDYVTDLAWSGDGTRLAIAGGEGRVFLARHDAGSSALAVRELGEHLMGALRRELAGVPGFVEVRGRGLMIGIELARPCNELVRQCLDAGLVLNVTADTVVRMLPPLIFTKDHADRVVETLVPLIRRHLGQGEARPA